MNFPTASPVERASSEAQTKGYAALETNEALDQARTLIEGAEALGEPPEDPFLLFSILYGFWAVNAVAFDGDAVRRLARQFLALAERQKATFPRMLGNRLMEFDANHQALAAYVMQKFVMRNCGR